MKKNTYRFILLLLGILLFLTISMGINFSSSLNGTLELPDAIESLSPMPGSQVPQQTTIEIDMPVGYEIVLYICLLYTSPSPRDGLLSRMPSSA